MVLHSLPPGYIFFLLLASSLLIEIHGQECDLPELPTGFRARVQMNSKKGFHSQKSHSYALVVDGDNNRSMIHSFREIHAQGRPIDVLEDWFIWDPTIDGIRNFLHVNRDQNNLYSCQADKGMDLYLFLLGYNEKDKAPSVENTLHFGPNHKYECGEESIMDGVPVKEYRTHWEQGTDPLYNLDIVYYWSDPNKWVGTAGLSQSIPIKGQMTGTFARPDEEIREIDISFVFASFEVLPLRYRYNWLSPFPAISCEGREGVVSLSLIGSVFNYNFETHTVLRTEEAEPITIRGKEFHDGQSSLLRRDMYFASPKNPSKIYNIRIIKDFEEGLAYETNINTGKHKIRPIKKTDEDAFVSEDGTMSLANSIFFWNMDQQYNCNNDVQLRGIDAYVFVTSLKSNSSEPKTFAVYFSSSCEADDFDYKCQVPIRTETHVTSLYGKPKASVIQNIEGFSTHERDFSTFDVSDCLEDGQIRRKMVRFPWTEEMSLNIYNIFEYPLIRFKLAETAKISKRRIQKIELQHSENSNTVYVFFDVLDAGKVDENHGIMSLREGITTLDMALENLRQSIDLSELELLIPKKDGGMTKVEVESGFFEDVISADSEAFQKHDFDEYSPGSMAGLGIGMIMVGTLLGFATYYGLWRVDKVPSFSTSAPFIHFP